MRYQIGAKVVETEQPLGDDEIDEIAAELGQEDVTRAGPTPPPSAEPEPKAEPRWSRQGMSVIEQPVLSEGVRSTIKAAIPTAAATAARVGGQLLGGLVTKSPGGVMAGGVAGEFIAEGIESAAGIRKHGISPKEIVVAGATAPITPALKGPRLIGGLLGAAMGGSEVAINEWASNEEQAIPLGWRMGLGMLFGGAFLAGARQLTKATSVSLGLSEEVAEDLGKIMTKQVPGGVSPAQYMEIKDLQRDLALVGGMSKQPRTSIPFQTLEGKWKTTKPSRPNDLSWLVAPTAKGQQQELSFDPGYLPVKQKGHVARQRFGITKEWMGRAQKSTGLPLVAEVFEPIERARIGMVEFNNSRIEEVERVFDGAKPEHYKRFQEWLEQPDHVKAFESMGFNTTERARADQLLGTYEKMFERFGLSKNKASEFFAIDMPKLRNMAEQLGPDASMDEIIEKAYKVHVPKAVTFFKDSLEDAIRGKPDAGLVLQDMLHGGSIESFMNPVKKHITEGIMKDANSDVADTVRDFISAASGGYDKVGQDLAVTIRDKFKFLGRYAPSLRDAKQLAEGFISLPYAATMGANPRPLLRNGLQTLMTSYAELGARDFRYGFKNLFTRRGQQLAERLGINAGQPLMTSEFQTEIASQGLGLLGKAGRSARALTGEMLHRYRNTDEANRVLAGLGMWNQAKRAVGQAKGSPDVFMDKIQLFSGKFLPADQEVISELAKQGNFQEASRRAAVAVADNTQWNMAMSNRPSVTRGTGGRMVGAFYNWGAFYRNYLGRLNPESKADAIRLARFVAVNGAMAGGAVAAHKAAGDPKARSGPRAAASQVYEDVVSPAIPGEGPLADFALSAMNYLSGDPRVSGKEVGRKAVSTLVPGSGMVRSMAKMSKADRGGPRGNVGLLNFLGL